MILNPSQPVEKTIMNNYNKFSLRNLITRKSANTNSSNESIFNNGNNSGDSQSDRISLQDHDLEPRFLRDRHRNANDGNMFRHNSEGDFTNISRRRSLMRRCSMNHEGGHSDGALNTNSSARHIPVQIYNNTSDRTGFSEITSDMQSLENPPGDDINSSAHQNQVDRQYADGQMADVEHPQKTSRPALETISSSSYPSNCSVGSSHDSSAPNAKLRIPNANNHKPSKFELPPPPLDSADNRWKQFDTGRELEAESWRASASAIANAAAVCAERLASMEEVTVVSEAPASRRSSRIGSISLDGMESVTGAGRRSSIAETTTSSHRGSLGGVPVDFDISSSTHSRMNYTNKVARRPSGKRDSGSSFQSRSRSASVHSQTPSYQRGYRSMSLDLQAEEHSKLGRRGKFIDDDDDDYFNPDADGEYNIIYDFERSKALLEKLDELSMDNSKGYSVGSSRSRSTPLLLADWNPNERLEKDRELTINEEIDGFVKGMDDKGMKRGTDKLCGMTKDFRNSTIMTRRDMMAANKQMSEITMADAMPSESILVDNQGTITGDVRDDNGIHHMSKLASTQAKERLGDNIRTPQNDVVSKVDSDLKSDKGNHKVIDSDSEDSVSGDMQLTLELLLRSRRVRGLMAKKDKDNHNKSDELASDCDSFDGSSLGSRKLKNDQSSPEKSEKTVSEVENAEDLGQDIRSRFKQDQQENISQRSLLSSFRSVGIASANSQKNMNAFNAFASSDDDDDSTTMLPLENSPHESDLYRDDASSASQSNPYKSLEIDNDSIDDDDDVDTAVQASSNSSRGHTGMITTVSYQNIPQDFFGAETLDDVEISRGDEEHGVLLAHKSRDEVVQNDIILDGDDQCNHDGNQGVRRILSDNSVVSSRSSNNVTVSPAAFLLGGIEGGDNQKKNDSEYGLWLASDQSESESESGSSGHQIEAEEQENELPKVEAGGLPWIDKRTKTHEGLTPYYYRDSVENLNKIGNVATDSNINDSWERSSTQSDSSLVTQWRPDSNRISLLSTITEESTGKIDDDHSNETSKYSAAMVLIPQDTTIMLNRERFAINEEHEESSQTEQATSTYCKHGALEENSVGLGDFAQAASSSQSGSSSSSEDPILSFKKRESIVISSNEIPDDLSREDSTEQLTDDDDDGGFIPWPPKSSPIPTEETYGDLLPRRNSEGAVSADTDKVSEEESKSTNTKSLVIPQLFSSGNSVKDATETDSMSRNENVGSYDIHGYSWTDQNKRNTEDKSEKLDDSEKVEGLSNPAKDSPMTSPLEDEIRDGFRGRDDGRITPSSEGEGEDGGMFIPWPNLNSPTTESEQEDPLISPKGTNESELDKTVNENKNGNDGVGNELSPPSHLAPGSQILMDNNLAFPKINQGEDTARSESSWPVDTMAVSDDDKEEFLPSPRNSEHSDNLWEESSASGEEEQDAMSKGSLENEVKQDINLNDIKSGVKDIVATAPSCKHEGKEDSCTYHSDGSGKSSIQVSYERKESNNTENSKAEGGAIASKEDKDQNAAVGTFSWDYEHDLLTKFSKEMITKENEGKDGTTKHTWQNDLRAGSNGHDNEIDTSNDMQSRQELQSSEMCIFSSASSKQQSRVQVASIQHNSYNNAEIIQRPNINLLYSRNPEEGENMKEERKNEGKNDIDKNDRDMVDLKPAKTPQISHDTFKISHTNNDDQVSDDDRSSSDNADLLSLPSDDEVIPRVPGAASFDSESDDEIGDILRSGSTLEVSTKTASMSKEPSNILKQRKDDTWSSFIRSNTDTTTNKKVDDFNNRRAGDRRSSIARSLESTKSDENHKKCIPWSSSNSHPDRGARNKLDLLGGDDMLPVSQKNLSDDKKNSGDINRGNTSGGSGSDLKKNDNQQVSRLFQRDDDNKDGREPDIESGLKKNNGQHEIAPLVTNSRSAYIDDINARSYRSRDQPARTNNCTNFSTIVIVCATILALTVSVVVLFQNQTSPPLLLTSDGIVPESPVGPGNGIRFENKVWIEQASILPTENLDDRAGYDIAISDDGTRLVVGGKDFSSDESAKIGIVRIYKLVEGEERGSKEWKEITSIIGERSLDQFGSAVSLSASGHLLVVGAPGYDKSSNDETNEGKVYVYDLSEENNEWEVEVKSFEGEKSNDRLGTSVSVDSLGDNIAMGAPQRDNAKGAVLVYTKDPRSDWYQIGDALFGTNNFDLFGTSVSLGLSGIHLAVGAPGDDRSDERGYVSVFKHRLSGTWEEVQRIRSKNDSDKFGKSISQTPDAKKLVIGAPYTMAETGMVYLYTRSNATATFEQTTETLVGFEVQDNFGMSVSLSPDGSRLSVGIPGRGKIQGELFGSAIVYKIDEKYELTPSIEIYGDKNQNFGTSVKLNANGSVAVVGVPSAGIIRSYT